MTEEYKKPRIGGFFFWMAMLNIAVGIFYQSEIPMLMAIFLAIVAGFDFIADTIIYSNHIR